MFDPAPSKTSVPWKDDPKPSPAFTLQGLFIVAASSVHALECACTASHQEESKNRNRHQSKYKRSNRRLYPYPMMGDRDRVGVWLCLVDGYYPSR